MTKRIEFPDLENTRLDDKIQKTMQREFPLPENVDAAKMNAFAQIREKQSKQEYANLAAEKTKQKQRKRKTFFRTCTGAAAAAAVFSGVCITNPAFAAQIPLVGHVFEEIGESLGFSGDFSKYATPIGEGAKSEVAESEAAEAENAEAETAASVDAAKASEGKEELGDGADGASDGKENAAENTSDTGKPLYSETKNGMTITLSELYCNDSALYVSMVLETEEKFPETMLMQEEGAPIVDLARSTLKFSYNDREFQSEGPLDGRMVDDHTYAGVLRYNLDCSADSSDYDAYYEKKNEFFLGLGITQDELNHMSEEVTAKICDLIGVENLTDEEIAEAGGPDFNDYLSKTEIPDSFSVELTIPQVVGTKPDAAFPDMPEDIRAEYEQAMTDNGLGLSDEDYENFTEEQKEIEHQLFIKMNQAYEERYPETTQYPNEYENWWVDGPWNFTFDVTKNDSETIVKEINDVDENGLGLVSVTKTPFELTVEDGGGYDYFTVVLDADGEIMDNGTFGGPTNVLALQDRDVSKVDIYICDYIEYMDELKGYYWSDDYEENKKTKTFKQLLDERALYHKEISFDEE